MGDIGPHDTFRSADLNGAPRDRKRGATPCGHNQSRDHLETRRLTRGAPQAALGSRRAPRDHLASPLIAAVQEQQPADDVGSGRSARARSARDRTPLQTSNARRTELVRLSSTPAKFPSDTYRRPCRPPQSGNETSSTRPGVLGGTNSRSKRRKGNESPQRISGAGCQPRTRTPSLPTHAKGRRLVRAVISAQCITKRLIQLNCRNALQ